MADKINLAKQIMNLSTRLEDIANEIEQVVGMWNARSHGAGGTDEIIDADISDLPVEASTLQAAEYSLEHFLLFIDNGDPAVSDHRANLEKARNIEGTYTIVLP